MRVRGVQGTLPSAPSAQAFHKGGKVHPFISFVFVQLEWGEYKTTSLLKFSNRNKNRLNLM